MIDLVESVRRSLPSPLRMLSWRAHPLDGKLLLFNRDTGLNLLVEGDETQHLLRLAPRTLLIAVTNACNMSCDFCYRSPGTRSTWSHDSLMQFCQAADRWGVLEVAFGGGEPLLFPRWSDFMLELHSTTHLAINFTTNGLLLTQKFLRTIEDSYGQIRLSLYKHNQWSERVALLSRCHARFGVNWLITPQELNVFEPKLMHLLSLGVRDILFLRYKGNVLPHLHLSKPELLQLASMVNAFRTQLDGAVQLKLDSCWGDALPHVPRLFPAADCEAGDDFVSITSDRCIKSCSFQTSAVPFETLDDVKQYWRQHRQTRSAAAIGGCARLSERERLEEGKQAYAYIDVAAVQQQS